MQIPNVRTHVILTRIDTTDITLQWKNFKISLLRKSISTAMGTL
jgi:hypothetical protein